MQRAKRTIEIDAPVERVFDLFSDFESFPRWMRNIKEVRYTGPRYTRWTADAPLGLNVEWEAETIAFERDQRIAWRTLRGDVDTEGEVVFQETPRGTTVIHVTLGYDAPTGRPGAMIARLFGANPQEQLAEDLERFANAVEGHRKRPWRARHEGEATPARERREYVRGQMERRRREAYDHRSHRVRYDERGGYDPYYAMHDDGDGSAEYFKGNNTARNDDRAEEDYRGERNYRAQRPLARREPDSHVSFEEALRETCHSQLEGMRHYRAERERDARQGFTGHRERDEHDWTNDDEARRDIERDWPNSRHAADDQRQTPGRHAITPRERELEHARRKADDEYTRVAFRRGIDKLMDEPPSKRWRR